MGLRPLPGGAFQIQDEGIWAAKAAVVDAWGLPSRALTDLDLNRRGTVINKPENGTRQLLGSIGEVPPSKFEARYYA
jgi:hypothetical protein